MRRILVLCLMIGLLATAAHAQDSGLKIIRVQIATEGDNVNELDGTLDANVNQLWVGNGESEEASYTGLRFVDVPLPAGAEIVSAHVVFYVPEDAWISMRFTMALDGSDDSPLFSADDLPSSRFLTNEQVVHESDAQWLAGNWYALDNISAAVQEVIDGSEWAAGNSLSVIMKGGGQPFARKFATSYEADARRAPVLVIAYR